MPVARVRAFAAIVLCFGVLASSAGVSTQTRVATQSAQVVQVPAGLDLQRAEDTRREFRTLLERYPPALGRVLKLDPTLMTNQGYMAAYPALAEFLSRHPELPRYTGYFLSHIGEYGAFEPTDAATIARRDAMGMWNNTVDGITVFGVFVAVMLTLAWLVRYVVSHRRWLRTSRVQAEVHGRLMEKMASNEDLLAYVQSAAGSKFLTGGPLDVEPAVGRSIGAPFSRILWSVQAGVVMIAGGIGLLLVRSRMDILEDVAQMIGVWGTLAISLGIGFAVSAGASYVISQRLGLLNSGADKDRT